VEFINSESYEEAHLSSSILWAIAPAATTRSTITALGAIKKLISLLKRTLAVRPCYNFLIRACPVLGSVRAQCMHVVMHVTLICH
jgi:hypothetical protein